MKRPVGGRAARLSADQREPDRAGVGEHVGGVGEQRQRVGQQAGDDLDDHEAEDQPEREPQLAAVGVGRDPVVMVVVMCHRFTACPPPPPTPPGPDGAPLLPSRGFVACGPEPRRGAARRRLAPTILSGSLSLPGRPGDARVFYRGLDVHTVDFTPALAAPDPLAADPPFHPSYEDREGAADQVFARLDDAAFERQVHAWARALADAGAGEADVLHLHHLTPLNEAAARVAPDVPVVGHLHGTELLMLEAIELGDAEWPYGEEWETRMRRWAKRCNA